MKYDKHAFFLYFERKKFILNNYYFFNKLGLLL